MASATESSPRQLPASTRQGCHGLQSQRHQRLASGRCARPSTVDPDLRNPPTSLTLKEAYIGLDSANVRGSIERPLSCIVTLAAFDGRSAIDDRPKITCAPDGMSLANLQRANITLLPSNVLLVTATVLDFDRLPDLGSTSAARMKNCGAGALMNW